MANAPVAPKQSEIWKRAANCTIAPGAPPSTFAPVPFAEDLAGGATGTAYSEQMSAAGGTGPYTYSVTAGALPTSLSLSSAGVISGTPTATGIFTFTVQVVDSKGYKGSEQFQITISAPSTGGGNYGYVA